MRAAIGGLVAAPSLWLLWGAVGVAAVLVVALAVRLLERREAPLPAPVVVATATGVAPPVASLVAPLPPETAPSASSAPATPSAPPLPSAPVRRTVRAHEGSGSARVPVDDVGDPFAEKR
jgi:hypothetical protein